MVGTGGDSCLQKNYMGRQLRPVKEGDEKNGAQTRGELDHVDQKKVGREGWQNFAILKYRGSESI